MKVRSLLWYIFIIIILPACATKPPPLVMVAPETESGTAHEIIVATSREPVGNPTQAYGDERSDELFFNLVSVWVPEDRQLGSIAYPKGDGDPDRQFGIKQFENIPRQNAKSLINERLARLPGEKSLFLFVHGYNVPYSSGVYRTGQILNDFENSSVAVHFSWPSKGTSTGYMYDRDSVQFSRDSFVELLTVLGSSDASSIFVMGHSMGTLLVMEGLRQLSLTGETAILEKIEPLVLASPDIDVDVFERQIESLGVRPDPIVVFVASDDRALRLSERLRGGHPRVGEGADIAALQDAGVTVIDLSDVELGDGNQHSAFASSPELIRLILQGRTAQDTLGDADAPQAYLSSNVWSSLPTGSYICRLPCLISNKGPLKRQQTMQRPPE
ncbi:MAG: alpha/beta fold hydrolase [Pseudomonadota bacterium]